MALIGELSGNDICSILSHAWIIYKKNRESKFPSGEVQDIGSITNGLRYTHSSWKISIPNGASHCRPFPASFAAKPITKRNIVLMQKRWDFEILSFKRSDYRGVFLFLESMWMD